MKSRAPVLEAKNLGLTFATREGRRVGLHDASLTIGQSEWIALLGPNGSGKSTLLSLASTAAPPESGTLSVAGIEIKQDTQRAKLALARASVGIAFQTPALDPLLTVDENLHTACALMGMRRTESMSRIKQLLSDLDLSDRARDRVGTLSGGLQRRADLARAMLSSPRLLILDEPTTGLDPDARRELLGVLDRLKQGIDAPPVSILYSTHLIDEADCADRVAMLAEGRIAAMGTPHELREKVGETTVSIHSRSPVAETILRQLDLTPNPSGTDRLTSPLGDADPCEIALACQSAQLAFTIGPPTLGDAYESIVGRSLGTESEHQGGSR